ncbi:hypothetical protein V6N13_048459 [Hibiscus sabdariffa]
MGYVLFQLEHNLRSQKEQLSPQEENFFQRWKSSALNQFTAGVIAGGGLVWAESWKLNRLLRVNLSGGGAIVLGLWRFKNSLDSSVDHILGLDGTRMQSELANMHVESGFELMTDPLECVFGCTATSDEIHHSTPSSMSSRAQRRANRRRRRAASSGSHVSKYSKFDGV